MSVILWGDKENVIGKLIKKKHNIQRVSYNVIVVDIVEGGSSGVTAQVKKKTKGNG